MPVNNNNNAYEFDTLNVFKVDWWQRTVSLSLLYHRAMALSTIVGTLKTYNMQLIREIFGRNLGKYLAAGNSNWFTNLIINIRRAKIWLL